MEIIRIMPNDLDEQLSESVAELQKPATIFYPRLQRDSFMDKIEKNFGFIIIGTMLVGAIIWTILMCG
jgi:hypothetical protein